MRNEALPATATKDQVKGSQAFGSLSAKASKQKQTIEKRMPKLRTQATFADAVRNVTGTKGHLKPPSLTRSSKSISPTQGLGERGQSGSKTMMSKPAKAATVQKNVESASANL